MTRGAILLALIACSDRPPGVAGVVQSCLDQQLTAKGLNQFGDPPDTMYPGGTPLFDEKTGQRRDRLQYVFARHPEIARACGLTPPDGGSPATR